MKKNFILLTSFFLSLSATAQVGVGNASPKVNMDARATVGNSAIALGNTNQTAGNAGVGAMKYDNGLYYSDGTNWVQTLGSQASTGFIPKVLASGRTTVAQTNIGMNTGIPPFLKFAFGGLLTNDGNWNAVTNTYTVATAGMYQMSFAGAITCNQLSNSSAWWIQVNENKYNVTLLSNTVSAYGGGSITLYLTTGNTIIFGSSHCKGCGGTDIYTIQPGNTFTISIVGTGS